MRQRRQQQQIVKRSAQLWLYSLWLVPQRHTRAPRKHSRSRMEHEVPQMAARLGRLRMKKLERPKWAVVVSPVDTLLVYSKDRPRKLSQWRESDVRRASVQCHSVCFGPMHVVHLLSRISPGLALQILARNEQSSGAR